MRVKDGWPLVKFLSRGGGVRVSHIVTGGFLMA